jgi:hypothetical protein
MNLLKVTFVGVLVSSCFTSALARVEIARDAKKTKRLYLVSNHGDGMMNPYQFLVTYRAPMTEPWPHRYQVWKAYPFPYHSIFRPEKNIWLGVFGSRVLQQTFSMPDNEEGFTCFNVYRRNVFVRSYCVDLQGFIPTAVSGVKASVVAGKVKLSWAPVRDPLVRSYSIVEFPPLHLRSGAKPSDLKPHLRPIGSKVLAGNLPQIELAEALPTTKGKAGKRCFGVRAHYAVTDPVQRAAPSDVEMIPLSVSAPRPFNGVCVEL